MDLDLVPAADETIACADHARLHHYDPGGTAIAADVLIAVEVPLPWPKPVFDHMAMRGLQEWAAGARRPTRILAAVPLDPASPEVLGVVRYERRGASMDRTEWSVAVDELRETVATAIAGVGEPSPTANSERVPRPEVWICTQGSHDRCCGSEGMRLAQTVAGRRSDVVVRRVSHTGGHRFAPTLLSMPDGRMWGHVDADLVDAILDHSDDVAAVLPHCRGWSGAPKGPGQIAERAALGEVGWSWDEFERSTTITAVGTDGACTVEVVGRDTDGSLRHFEVDVVEGRRVPTIACSMPGGQPIKPAVEYEVVDLRRLELGGTVDRTDDRPH